MKKIIKSALDVIAYAFFFFAPWTIAGTQGALVIGIALATLMLMLYPSTAIKTARLLLFIVLYYVAYFIANMFSGNFYSSMSSLLNEWLPLTVIFWGVLDWDEKKIKRGIDIFVSVAAIFSVCAIVQHFWGWNFLRGKPLEPIEHFYIALGPYNEHLTFGGAYFLISFFILGYLLSKAEKNVLRKKLYWAFFVISSMAVVFSYSRSIWIAMVFSAIVAASFAGRRAVMWTVGIIAAAFGSFLAFFPSVLWRVSTLFNPSFGSNVNRIVLWKTALNMIKHSPIVGLGSGAFVRRFDEFFAGGYCPIRGHPHSDILNILVEAGIIGLIAYTGIFVVFFRASYRAVKDGSGVWKGYAMGAIVATAGIILAGLFECNFVNDEIEEILFFILSVGVVASWKVESQSRKIGEV
ncbi:O-antigen ligase family protein [bacterium]|nr:O-antigen ligase family protein [bacterium]